MVKATQTWGAQCKCPRASLNCSCSCTLSGPQPHKGFTRRFLPQLYLIAWLFVLLALSLFPYRSPPCTPVSGQPFCCTAGRTILQMKSFPVPPACRCSAHCATPACFVNNHLFVAGIVAAITSDLPVSSIMDRLLDVNSCKSLLLNSPPGWDQIKY